MKSIFISARLNSSRLPRKATLELCGNPSIYYLIENLKKSKIAEEIILCTTLKKEDGALCEIAEISNIKYFRGSSEDKLLRWNDACKEYGVDFFVNVDGDDLFFDAPLADMCLEQSEDIDFIDGRGLYNDVYGISASALDVVCNMKKGADTEFIRPHFVNTARGFSVRKIKNVPDKYKKKDIRMTLDYAEDLLFFETVIQHFKAANLKMTFDGILDYLEKNPDVVEINWFREQEWKDNQRRMISRVVP